MARWTRFVPTLAVALLLWGCGQATDTPLSPPAARYDGGLTMGGNATPPPPDSTTSTTSSEVPQDSAGRGGLTLGGN